MDSSFYKVYNFHVISWLLLKSMGRALQLCKGKVLTPKSFSFRKQSLKSKFIIKLNGFSFHSTHSLLCGSLVDTLTFTWSKIKICLWSNKNQCCYASYQLTFKPLIRHLLWNEIEGKNFNFYESAHQGTILWMTCCFHTQIFVRARNYCCK